MLDSVGNGGIFGACAIVEDTSQALRTADSIPPEHAQPLDVDASRQPTLDSSADQLGSKEGERDGHVDMTDAALLAQRNLLSAGDGSGDDFIQPAPASRGGADETEPSFRPLRSDLLSRGTMGQQDLPESLGRRLLPGNGQKAIIGWFFDIACQFRRPWIFS